MNTLFVDRRDTELDHANRAVRIREPDARPRHVPLHLLDRVVIAGQVRIASTLLAQLGAQGVAVTVLPARGGAAGTQLAVNGSGDARRRLGQYALVSHPATAGQWAARFVAGRLLGQIRLLERMARTRPDRRRALLRPVPGLRQSLAAVRAAPPLPRQRGLEGAATRRFLAGYRHALPPGLGFRGRNRRPPRDPVNAVLSLGYTLAHGDALHAIHAAGLDPMLGCLHQPLHNRESLACDFVELARARVELLVWRLFAERTLTAARFSDETDGVRLDKIGRAAFYAAWTAQAGIHRRAFRRHARLLATAADQQPSHCEEATNER